MRIVVKCPCGAEFQVRVVIVQKGGGRLCRSCRAKRPRKGAQKFPYPDESTPQIRQKAKNAVLRCTDPSHSKFHHYGGRGITVFQEWLDDLSKFVAHLMTLPGWDNPQLRLDRRDNSKGYEPGNLQFVTVSESMRNRRRWGTSRSTIYRRRAGG